MAKESAPSRKKQSKETIGGENLNFFSQMLIRAKLVKLRVEELSHRLELIIPAAYAQARKTSLRAANTFSAIESSAATLLGETENQDDRVLNEVFDIVAERQKPLVDEAERHGVGIDQAGVLSESARVVRSEWERENQVFADRVSRGLVGENLTRHLVQFEKLTQAHNSGSTHVYIENIGTFLEGAKRRIASLEAPRAAAHEPLSKKHLERYVKTLRSEMLVLEGHLKEVARTVNERLLTLQAENPLSTKNARIASLEDLDGPMAGEGQALNALHETIKREVLPWLSKVLYENADPRTSVLFDAQKAGELLEDSHRILATAELAIRGIQKDTEKLQQVREKLIDVRRRAAELEEKVSAPKKRASRKKKQPSGAR